MPSIIYQFKIYSDQSLSGVPLFVAPWTSFSTPVSSVFYHLLDGEITMERFSSVAQSCPTLCDPMDCSTPGLPVHHQLPELAQTHVHLVGDGIQPSHPLSSPSPAFSLS